MIKELLEIFGYGSGYGSGYYGNGFGYYGDGYGSGYYGNGYGDGDGNGCNGDDPNDKIKAGLEIINE